MTGMGGRIIRGILWSMASSYVVFALSLLGQLALVRMLAPEDFGNFAMAASVFGFLSIATAWSFPTAIIQMGKDGDLSDTAFWLSIAQAIIVLSLSLIVSYALSVFYPENKVLPLVFPVIGAARAASVVSALYSAHLEKELNYGSISAVKVGASVFSTAAAVAMALKGFGIWSLVSKEVVYALFTAVGFRQVSSWRFGWRFSREKAGGLIRFSNKTLVSKGLESASSRLDNFIVGLAGGITTLGYYSQARYIVDIVNAAVNPVSVVAFPAYAKIKHTAEHIRRAYRLHSDFLLWATMPALLIFAIFPAEFITLLFGPKWLPSADILRWLAPYVVLMPIFMALRALLYGLGRIGADIMIQSFQMAVAAVSIAAGALRFGPPGAAAGQVFSIAVGIAAGYAFLNKYTWEGAARRALPPLFSFAATFLLVLFVRGRVSYGAGGAEAAAWMAATALSYLALLFLIDRKNLIENFRLIRERAVRTDGACAEDK